ncbi:MAG: hypothetical protein RSE46_24000, partial [Janthinobacterium sp.]
WANAYAAATQGLGTFTQGLNQEYDARYKVIAAMEEGKKKQQALGELQAWYNEQALNGAKAYYAALKQSAQETGVFDQGGKYEATIDQLEQVSTLIGKVSKGEAPETELTDALSGLDEANVLEVTAALADMQSAAKQAGETLPSDMQGILTAIENIKTAYQTTDNVFNESLTNSLKKMFGEGMDAEVYEIHATLNADGLNTSYNAWAAGTHADIIPTIDTTGVTVDGVTATISVVTGDGGIFTIKDFTLNPLTGHVETVTADGKTMSIRDLTLNPEKGHVTVITADGKALPIDDLTIDPQTGTVTALTSDGETLTISIPEKDQLSGTLVAIAEGAGVVKPVIQLQGEVAEVSYKPGDKFSNSGRPDLEYNKG